MAGPNKRPVTLGELLVSLLAYVVRCSYATCKSIILDGVFGRRRTDTLRRRSVHSGRSPAHPGENSLREGLGEPLMPSILIATANPSGLPTDAVRIPIPHLAHQHSSTTAALVQPSRRS